MNKQYVGMTSLRFESRRLIEEVDKGQIVYVTHINSPVMRLAPADVLPDDCNSVSASKLRSCLSSVWGSIRKGSKGVYITRNGRRVAALVGVDFEGETGDE